MSYRNHIWAGEGGGGQQASPSTSPPAPPPAAGRPNPQPRPRPPPPPRGANLRAPPRASPQPSSPPVRIARPRGRQRRAAGRGSDGARRRPGRGAPGGGGGRRLGRGRGEPAALRSGAALGGCGNRGSRTGWGAGGGGGRGGGGWGTATRSAAFRSRGEGTGAAGAGGGGAEEPCGSRDGESALPDVSARVRELPRARAAPEGQARGRQFGGGSTVGEGPSPSAGRHCGQGQGADSEPGRLCSAISSRQEAEAARGARRRARGRGCQTSTEGAEQRRGLWARGGQPKHPLFDADSGPPRQREGAGQEGEEAELDEASSPAQPVRSRAQLHQGAGAALPGQR